MFCSLMILINKTRTRTLQYTTLLHASNKRITRKTRETYIILKKATERILLNNLNLMTTRTRTSSVIMNNNNNNCYSIIIAVRLLLLILNIIIISMPSSSSSSSTTTTTTTTKSKSKSKSFFIVLPFVESFCNSPSQLILLPSHLRRHHHRRHHHHHHALSLSSSSSKIRTNINIKVGTVTNNKSAFDVVAVAVVADNGRINNDNNNNNNNNNVINKNSQDSNKHEETIMMTSPSPSSIITATSTSSSPNNNNNHAAAAAAAVIISRRNIFGLLAASITTTITAIISYPIQPVNAYTPDPDKLQESLYLISRVQEATVQQERYITNAYKNQSSSGSSSSASKELQMKLKLTLKLVEKNYKLLDQINYCSQYIQPEEKLIDSSEAGYKAVDELQNAIDYVRNDNNWSDDDDDDGGTAVVVTDQQCMYLISSLQECREQLFIFLKYISPIEKLYVARLRVENENIQNRIEFGNANDIDIDTKNSNAGVFNPVILPWK